VFRTLVAPRASSSTEDGGVVNDGDSATVPYFLDNCGLPSWSTARQLALSKGSRLQRIVNRAVDSIDTSAEVYVYVLEVQYRRYWG
jgi:hypothetical protein